MQGKHPAFMSATSRQKPLHMRNDCEAQIQTSVWRLWIKNVRCLSSLMKLHTAGKTFHSISSVSLASHRILVHLIPSSDFMPFSSEVWSVVSKRNSIGFVSTCVHASSRTASEHVLYLHLVTLVVANDSVFFTSSSETTTATESL